MSSAPHPDEPRFSDIEAARQRIAGQAVRTPLLESPLFNERVGGRVFFKPECLQRTGSFKFRGAYNKLKKLKDAGAAEAVVAFSSGNHAQGVAAAAQLLGLRATIVMPADAPAIKVRNTRGYGADVVLYDRDSEDREAIGRRVAAETGAVLVPPFDDPDVISGQGTIGLEILEDAAAAGVTLDAVLCCCGGGGLISGLALAIKSRRPDLPIHAVEPAGFDDTLRSLQSGTRQKVTPGAKSFCDALLSPMPGEITFSLNSRLLDGAFSVTDAEVAEGMRAAFTDLKLVTEPGGTVALAAVLAGKLPTKGRAIAVVISGGNVDPELYAGILTGNH